MSKRITQEEWVTIIEEAAMSGVRVSEYCREKEISEKILSPYSISALYLEK